MHYSRVPSVHSSLLWMAVFLSLSFCWNSSPSACLSASASTYLIFIPHLLLSAFTSYLLVRACLFLCSLPFFFVCFLSQFVSICLCIAVFICVWVSVFVLCVVCVCLCLYLCHPASLCLPSVPLFTFLALSLSTSFLRLAPSDIYLHQSTLVTPNAPLRYFPWALSPHLFFIPPCLSMSLFPFPLQ